MILNVTVGLRLTDASIRLSSDSDCNEQRAAAAGQRIVRIIAFLLREYSGGKVNIFIE